MKSRSGLGSARNCGPCRQPALNQAIPFILAPGSFMLVRTPPRDDRIFAASIATAVVAAVTILGAYYFQYILGLAPCPLCLDERIPYYVAIPLAGSIAIGARGHASRGLLMAGLLVVGLVMLASAALGAYHAGVEWQFWPGPADCSGPIQSFGRTSDLLRQLNSVRVVRCDAAAWRFLGVSLAGYNVLISLALAAIAAWALKASRQA
jgi:disulfide bond formation protein DsbB